MSNNVENAETGTIGPRKGKPEEDDASTEEDGNNTDRVKEDQPSVTKFFPEACEENCTADF